MTNQLPNVTFTLGRSYAGNLPVDRPGHPNDTLFFVGYEKTRGSLTASANERADEPWGIWLNGGWVVRFSTGDRADMTVVPDPRVWLVCSSRYAYGYRMEAT